MSFRFSVRLGWIAVVLVCFSLAASARAAVEDSAIDAAAKEYQRLFSDSREAGERPGQADMGDFVDKAMASIPLDQLTLDQIQHAVQVMPVQFAPKTSAALEALLKKQAESKDADGAWAAIIRVQLTPFNAKKEDQITRFNEALAHPGIKEAVAKGHGAALFEAATSLDADAVRSSREALLSLQDSARPDAPAAFFSKAANFFMSIVHTLGAEEAQTFAPLREKIAAALQEKLKGQVDPKEQQQLEQAAGRLNGAFARGALVGAKAPPIDFIWFIDPANPNHKIKSLDDLKGKVVVLDFWATWCGPCIASFPKVKAVNRYYRGYDVVVVGVTSLQGFHSGPNGRIDTKDNPQKEFDLMPEFMKQKDMTWPVAFSKQNVFNPDYGVTGIPNMVIIDTKGIVRYAGLHPGAVSLDEKVAMIDKLLGEGGKPLPAALLIPKKPE